MFFSALISYQNAIKWKFHHAISCTDGDCKYSTDLDCNCSCQSSSKKQIDTAMDNLKWFLMILRPCCLQNPEFQQNHFLYGQKKDKHAYQKV